VSVDEGRHLVLDVGYQFAVDADLDALTPEERATSLAVSSAS
jgi:hypothetical protein